MGTHWKITAPQCEEIVERYRSGEKCSAIASRFNISHTYVSFLAKKAGGPMRGSWHVNALVRRERA